MSDNNFDLAELTEGMTSQEAFEFIRTTLTPQAKAQFLAKRKENGLLAKYRQEMDNPELMKLPLNARSKRMVAIQARYRDMGIEVY